MIKNVKIRIFAFVMAVTLSFCVVSSEYQEVKALEWAGTVVAFDTAIKAILGLLGVGVAVGTASQIDWGQLKDDCVEYQIAQGNNSAMVGKWWNDVINGALDTGSSCWSAFKSWVSNELLSSGNSSDSVFINDTDFKVGSTTYNIQGFNAYYGTFLINNVENTGFFSTSIALSNNRAGNFFIASDTPFPDSSAVNNLYRTSATYFDKTVYYKYTYRNYKFDFSPISDYEINANSLYDNNIYVSICAWLSVYGESSAISSDFDSALSDLGAIGLAPDVATDLPYDGVIDIPWENVGATDTAIDDAFDDALDKVNTGTWTLDQYWTWVQNVTNVFAYDTTNNFLLPNDGDDEKADDKVQQNINRGAMVLYGLEKVFPFCIPWDIYAFVNLLVADPVAPVIEYPLYNSVSGEYEIITIDFSVWESQVILMRYIQDFLLIIGLLLLARSLIGAGGSE